MCESNNKKKCKNQTNNMNNKSNQIIKNYNNRINNNNTKTYVPVYSILNTIF